MILAPFIKIVGWTVERVERVNPPTPTGDLGFVLRKDGGE